MHAKAKRADFADRVHDKEEFLSFLQGQVRSVHHDFPTECVNVETITVSHLDSSDVLFDSIRTDYKGFNQWLAKCAEEGRKAWIVREGRVIGALCIFKEETDETVCADGSRLAGRSLKLCTFKVVARGKKLGERLLQVALLHAWRNGFRHVYLHTRTEEQPHLVRLLEDFGFENRGRHATSKQDDVYLKPMIPDENEIPIERRDFLNFAIRYYPNVRFDGLIHRYLVPIQPQFHERLFPDAHKQMRLFDYSGSESNGIRKAYLCRSLTNSLGTGDVLFFYQSKPVKTIECFGIVESVARLDNPSDIIPLVSKRTVYSEEEIREKAATNGALLVILFRLVRLFPNPVTLRQLQDNGVNGKIRSIRRLPDAAFDALFKPLLEQPK